MDFAGQCRDGGCGREQLGARLLAGSGPSDVWALGVTTALHWDGHAFSPAPAPEVYPTALWSGGPGDLWALSTGPEPSAHWNGTSWVSAPPGRGIHGSSPSDVWLVGEGGLIDHYDGATWRPVSERLAESVDAIRAFAGGEAFAASDAILHRDVNGWSVPSGPGASAIGGVAPGDLWTSAIGTGSMTHWNGQIWSMEPLPDALEVAAIWASAPNDVWAVGMMFPGGVYYARSRIMHWNGTAWSLTLEGTSSTDFGSTYSSLWGSSATDVWAVDDQGTVMGSRADVDDVCAPACDLDDADGTVPRVEDDRERDLHLEPTHEPAEDDRGLERQANRAASVHLDVRGNAPQLQLGDAHGRGPDQ